MRERNLLKRYGEGSWAMITEASHGLGWNLSKKLARRGFKLILIDKSGERLSEKITLLEEMLSKTSNPPFNYDKNELRFMGIQADFALGDNPNFYDQIMWKINQMQISPKDISLLVLSPKSLNMSAPTPSIGKSIGFVKDHIFPATMLTKKLLPGFHQRLTENGLTSGIIMISSIAGLMPIKELGLYSAVQSYLNYFSEGYNLGYHGKFDILTVTPPLVVKGSGVEADGNTVTECGDGIVRALGNLDRTYGCRKHVLFGFCVDLLMTLGLTCVVQWFMGGMEAAGSEGPRASDEDRQKM
jgi:17beta-estradiol 17-dehydrogenase / very-long-chain 3-oxoacyl-CoA reductase